MTYPIWLNSIESAKTFFRTYPEIFIFSLISIGVLGFFTYISNENLKDVIEIKGHYADGDQKFQDKLKTKSVIDSIALCSNLKTVYFYINDIKKSKMYLATKYQRFFIVCYTVGIFFIILTAVIAFVVTKKGWDNSARKRKGLLLTCAFYGILLPTFPKLFDQEKNYKNNFADYTALTNGQLYIYSRLNPFLGKVDNKLNNKDSSTLLNTMDTATTIIMQHLNIDISIDRNQLEGKTIDFK